MKVILTFQSEQEANKEVIIYNQNTDPNAPLHIGRY